MLTLRVIFRAMNDDRWLHVVDLNREGRGHIGDSEFGLDEDSHQSHIFYNVEELNAFIADVTRSLNMRGPAGEDYDENMEWHKGVTRTIRKYLRDPDTRWAFSFEICQVRLESMGRVTVALRSDIL